MNPILVINAGPADHGSFPDQAMDNLRDFIILNHAHGYVIRHYLEESTDVELLMVGPIEACVAFFGIDFYEIDPIKLLSYFDGSETQLFWDGPGNQILISHPEVDADKMFTISEWLEAVYKHLNSSSNEVILGHTYTYDLKIAEEWVKNYKYAGKYKLSDDGPFKHIFMPNDPEKNRMVVWTQDMITTENINISDY